MNRSLLIICILFISSCHPDKNSGINQILDFNTFPLEVPENNSLLSRWEEKTILSSQLLDDMESAIGWKVEGIGEMSYTHEHAMDGVQSLRFRTSKRDTAFYRQHRTQWNSLSAESGGTTSLLLTFEEPRDWTEYNRLSLWVYVHPTSMPTYCITLSIDNEGTEYNATTPRESHFVQDLKPGEWNHVLFEIPHIQRDKVTQFSISQPLTGHNPEEEGIVTYDFDKLELEKVISDKFQGWTVSPQKISYSQIGYRPGDLKIALAGKNEVDSFQLLNEENDVVFSGNVTVINNINGQFHQLDFSEFNEEGTYRIRCGSLESKPFPINENIWIDPLFKAINFYFCERCGYDVPGIHRACHKDLQGFHGNEVKIINGGWHDAGDLCQGYWRTAMATYAMLRNLENIGERKELSKLADRIRSEIVWGLEWMLNTRFGDGFHMSWSTIRIYTDNKTGTIDDVISPARNVPWENFLAAGVLGKASRMLSKSHPELATRAGVAAIEDWDAAVASGEEWDQAGYREAAWGVISSLILAECTGEDKYSDFALRFGDLLMQCQEQEFIDGIPVTGYFYNSTDQKWPIHNNHTAFEEAHMIAVSMLCRQFPENENWIKWYSSAVMYGEYFMKRGSVIAEPYYMLPNSVYKRQEFLADADETAKADNLRQFNDGTRLSEDYVLRTFPIWRDNLFHGNTNVTLSATWALAEASEIRNDPEGMQLAGKQLQWLFGFNPFSQSLMYGVGYDFAPQFAFCLKDVVGSLPVGIDCMSGDEPFWPSSNYPTYKEIWMEPVSRFLGTLSVYNGIDHHASDKNAEKKTITVHGEKEFNGDDLVSVSLNISGKGNHQLEFKSFNASAEIDKLTVDLSNTPGEIIRIKLKVVDAAKPYVVVIIADQDPDLRWEITGSLMDNYIAFPTSEM